MTNILTFHKPEKIKLKKGNEFEGEFEFKPLEPGFGQTIGNSLRRVLLSSLEGWAISSVRIVDVDHEFSVIEGVREDVVDIILNLKQVRFKFLREDQNTVEEKIYISFTGKEEFRAGDIQAYTNMFEITNPDLLICEMEPWVNLDMELTLTKGRGYVPAEENVDENAPIGVIPVDAIYTPIKNVAYTVSNVRVGQKTDYEKLTLYVKTDGTITPEDAVKQAAKILIDHLALIVREKIDLDTEEDHKEVQMDEEILHKRKLLKTPLEDLELSVRAFNCLKAARINTLADLVQYEPHELLKFRNFGKKSLVEIEELLKDLGLTLGMDVSKYQIDENHR